MSTIHRPGGSLRTVLRNHLAERATLHEPRMRQSSLWAALLALKRGGTTGIVSLEGGENAHFGQLDSLISEGPKFSHA